MIEEKQRQISDKPFEEVESKALATAKQVKDEVKEKLEKEDYSGLNTNLLEMTKDNSQNEKYIFKPEERKKDIAFLILILIVAMAEIYLAFIGAFSAFFSKTYFISGIMILVLCLICLIINARVSYKRIVNIRKNEIYEVYYDQLYCKSYCYIDDMIQSCNRNLEQVLSDLQDAIDRKLIPQGHFSNEKNVFFVSDHAFSKYEEMAVVYDDYFKKQLEERNRIRERTPEIINILATGDQYVEKLQYIENQISNKNIKSKILMMKKTITSIFRELDMNSNYVGSLNLFLDYYLPTTEKLLDTYLEIDSKPNIPNIRKAKKEIYDSICLIVSVYEGILDRLYEDIEFDISSEVSALEIITSQEGLADEK